MIDGNLIALAILLIPAVWLVLKYLRERNRRGGG